MKKNGLSFILEKLYEQVPAEVKKDIFKRKSGVMNAGHTAVRMQPYIPFEIYVMMEYFGALHESESAVFTSLISEHLEIRAMRLGILNTMAQHAGGR